ncbi:hypothetical protein TVNIR_2761 [Thioalkalivibrio nitratireducens DSM 14787]|uniref:Uncharacterized protein n=1 Tax=Thioalkalivibrio nitratireducens (strain DSM 14787 / UNIQEM 213 / ALEN2) TaxID=1255043 RepID=L0DXV4_THIND|nr:hypothetical protein TVNIR_2761 [Thioalkalivibrio nitratireducens DSM 14787]
MPPLVVGRSGPRRRGRPCGELAGGEDPPAHRAPASRMEHPHAKSVPDRSGPLSQLPGPCVWSRRCAERRFTGPERNRLFQAGTRRCRLAPEIPPHDAPQLCWHGSRYVLVTATNAVCWSPIARNAKRPPVLFRSTLSTWRSQQ